MIFFFFFTLLVIGGSFVFCLYIYPKIILFDDFPKRAIANIIEANPRYALSFINQAISYGEKGQIEKACTDLKLACDLGYCEYNNLKRIFQA